MRRAPRALALVTVLVVSACAPAGPEEPTPTPSPTPTPPAGPAPAAAPSVTSLSPARIVAGRGAFTLTVTGDGFEPATTVSWRGAVLAAVRVDARTIRAQVPAELAAAPGSDPVTVATPAPGGGAASAALAVAPAPVLTSVSPAEGRVGATVTLQGANLGADVARAATLGGVPLAVTSWTDGRIVGVIPPGARGGPVRVTLDGVASADRPFTVTAPVTGRLVNDTPLSDGYLNGYGDHRLVVRVEGTDRAVRTWFGQSFSLEAPLGPQALVVEDARVDGGDLDLFQAATRRLAVDVGEAGVAGAELRLRWHWESSPLDGGAAFLACGRGAQLHFHDDQHGVATFRVDANAEHAGLHGAAAVTADGGASWSLLDPVMLADSETNPFRPRAGDWVHGGYLTATGGGSTLLSLGDNGVLARSTDGGASWARTWLDFDTYGPGAATATRFAESAGALYVGVDTGGVQGSRQRTALSRSTDGGATWARLLDRCDSDRVEDGCSSVHRQEPLRFTGLDLACAGGGRCVSVGVEWAMVTADGFQTWRTFRPGDFGGCWTGHALSARVVWLPGTDTAWLVASEGCFFSTRRKVTTDGGATWGEWEPSPVSAAAHTVFVDARRGFSADAAGVRVTIDGGETWAWTGPAPVEPGSRQTMVARDASHVWVLGSPDCRDTAAAAVARWVP